VRGRTAVRLRPHAHLSDELNLKPDRNAAETQRLDPALRHRVSA
jgi:hypothetical protein